MTGSTSEVERKLALLTRELEEARAELAETLEQQAATSDILRLISSSPTDVQPVFDTIAESVVRIFQLPFCAVFRFDGKLIHFAAHSGLGEEGAAEMRRVYPLQPGRGSSVARAIASGSVEQIVDVRVDPDYVVRGAADSIKARAILGVPILKEGRPVGAISTAKTSPGPFPKRQIELLRTFADQAVIAIENVRLFEAVQARTAELTESLQQQTATADVLKVISRSAFDLDTVMKTLIETGIELCEAARGAIWLRKGEQFHLVAHVGVTEEWVALAKSNPLVPSADATTLAGLALFTGEIVHVEDIPTDPRFCFIEMHKHGGYHTGIAVPLKREGRIEGVFGLSRSERKLYTDRQIALIQTFADQAVIAIQNARLFDEVQTRNRELTEALEQQVATSSILRVIAASPTDIQPVLDTVTESAARLCDAYDAALFLRSGDVLAVAAHHGAITIDFTELPLVRDVVTSRAVLDRAPVHVHDLTAADEEFLAGQTMARRLGFRTILSTPLLREGEAVGALMIRRAEVRPFSEKQIDLLKTFADQAVIAIENVRLFEQVQQRNRELTELLEQQTATSDILRVISRSPTDVQPVFDTIAESAARLCVAKLCFVYRFDGTLLHFMAHHGLNQEALDAVRATFPIAPGRGSAGARSVLSGSVEHIPDVWEDPDYALGALSQIVNSRSVVAVPMVRDGVPIGAIALDRSEPGCFPARQIELLQTFADQAVIAIENVRLFEEVEARNRDLTESLERQTAMSDILRVISRSPTDVQPVFETIAESAARLCDARFCNVFRFDGELIHFVAQHGFPPEAIDAQRRAFPMRPGQGSGASRAILSADIHQIPDVNADPDYQLGETMRAIDARSVLAVPMVRDGRAVGSINIGRQEPGDFPSRQIDLLKTFADQAVIAIENVRLFEEVQVRTAELSEALQQQTAAADVLKVISRSAFDLQSVLQTLIISACKLCGSDEGGIFMLDGDLYRLAANYGATPALVAYEVDHPAPIGRDSYVGRTALERAVVHIPDVLKDAEYGSPELAELGDFRAVLSVPLMREGFPIGVFAMGRAKPGPFSQRQIELVQTFADQAVIAIENVRLFEEVQTRNREVTEALERQTATSDVLSVISRSTFQLQPVLDTIVATASRLCNAEYALVFRLREGKYHVAAANNATADFIRHASEHPIPPGCGSLIGRTALHGKTVHLPDCLADPEYTFVDYQRSGRYRTMLGVPLLREGVVIGVIGLMRTVVEPFTDKQIELVSTFADQAVIAIENVRLFEEVQARTAELSEALEQQTATSEVLQAISSSPGELGPVFQAILENATRICEAKIGILFRYHDGAYNAVAHLGIPPEFAEYLARGPRHPNPDTTFARLVKDKKTVHVVDTRAEPVYASGDPQRVATVELLHARSLLDVPMLKDGELIGAISIIRDEVRAFTDKQIELVTNFAAQAVIAIENTRLLKELREALQQQTATADVLKVISRSAFELETVLQTLVESAARLCDADKATITRQVEGKFYRAEAYGFSSEFIDYVRTIPVEPERGSATGRALLTGRIVHIADTEIDSEYTFHEARKLGGFRTILGVPMLREGVPTGVLALTRSEVRPFSEKQIELVSTFADQAAIAMENARLFEEVRARTRDLSRSLEELRTAQDRLVQTEKLASLGQLTAGIAHEIKNPLNFVNNFSSLSAELLDELREVLDDAPLAGELRAEVEELSTMLKGNLDKVVQHGRRADSIVKNMLLHSRQGSSEHRPADINAIVEESLNLAYHGARAEKQGFNVTLEKSLDPAAGDVDLFPQEITRVLLNLISNGFYATTKRREAADGSAYEPTLIAATKSLGDRVEIRIRDNGTGIPREVRERMFDPFFTTKPAGEGTGLGLSLSHDIIVKQHSGTIEVETEPGEFTEFRIVLPRAGAALAQSGGKR